jgi:Sigma-70 region 2
MASGSCGVFRNSQRLDPLGIKGIPSSFPGPVRRWIVRRECSRGRSASCASEGPWPVGTNLGRPVPSGVRSVLTAGGDARDFPGSPGAERARVLLTEEQRALAVRYLPLARHLSRRLYATSPTHPAELHATACMALAEAARNYDRSRKVGFGTYARHRIRAALRDSQRDFTGCTASPSPG